MQTQTQQQPDPIPALVSYVKKRIGKEGNRKIIDRRRLPEQQIPSVLPTRRERT